MEPRSRWRIRSLLPVSGHRNDRLRRIHIPTDELAGRVGVRRFESGDHDVRQPQRRRRGVHHVGVPRARWCVNGRMFRVSIRAFFIERLATTISQSTIAIVDYRCR